MSAKAPFVKLEGLSVESWTVGQRWARNAGNAGSHFSSGGTYGMVVGHVAPEAAVGDAIALIQEGDTITIDAPARLLQLNVLDEELERRHANWQPPKPRYTRGMLAKYAKLVSSSRVGAVTDLG